MATLKIFSAFLFFTFFLSCGILQEKVKESSTEETSVLEPKIKHIYGNGSKETIFKDSLLIIGENFTENMKVLLAGDSGEKGLSTDFTDDTEVNAKLYEEIKPGKYKLIVENDAGWDQKEVEILQGEPGLPCWDLNGNGKSDSEEDLNKDKNIDVLDCKGVKGENGADGPKGENGLNGSNGLKGSKGERGLPGTDGSSRVIIADNIKLLNFEGPFGKVIDDRTTDVLLGIKKSVLEEQLLYMPSYFYNYPGRTEPDYFGVKVVWFSKSGDSVYLHESMENKTVDEYLPIDRILTAFDILYESEDAIAIDFNAGISQFYYDFSIMSATDFDCFDTDCFIYDDTPVVPYKIQDSYLDDFVVKGESVFISQVLNMNLWDDVVMKPTMVAYHSFKPYEENQNFSPKFTNFQQHVGFFETNPFLEKGKYPKPQYYIEKWDISKPIKFSISANTPLELRESITEGILYWNLVFGADVVEVEVLEDYTIQPTNPDYNVIQWVDWANDYAYAMFQANPLTGEILHGGVYLPNWTGAITSIDVESTGSVSKAEEISNFKKSGTLFKDPVGQFILKEDKIFNKKVFIKRNLSGFLAKKAGNSEFSEEIIDSYRALVAHEVGHVLGLRHNFAGNIGSNLDHAEYEAAADNFNFFGEIVEGEYPSSTVMDYNLSTEDAWIGRIIRQFPLPYDETAIKWGYYDEELENLETPPFCSDYNATFSMNYDCTAFDTQKNPILAGFYDFNNYYSEAVVENLVNTFIRAKAPFYNFEKVRNLEDLSFDPANDAFISILPMLNTSIGLVPGNRFIAVENNFKSEVNSDYFSYMNNDVIMQANEEYVLDTLLQNEGINFIVYTLIYMSEENVPYPDPIMDIKTKFDESVDSDWFKQGETVYGVPYSFTDQEIITIHEIGEKYFNDLSNYYYDYAFQIHEIFKNDFEHWHSLDPLFAQGDVQAIQDYFYDITPKIIKAKQSSYIEAHILGHETPVNVEKYFYSTEIRNSILEKLVTFSIFQADEFWADSLKEDLHTELLINFEFTKSNIMNVINALLGDELIPYYVDPSPEMNGEGVIDPSIFNLLPPDLKTWIEDEQEILSQLAPEIIPDPEPDPDPTVEPTP